MVGRLFSQDPALYREILRENPRGARVRERFVEQANALRAAIDDDTAFDRIFEETAAYFADFSEEAMALSDHIIETIMSRP